MDAISGADQLIDACLQRQPFAWQRLVDECAPVVVQTIVQTGSAAGRQYSREDVDRLTRGVFAWLRDDDFAALCSLDRRANIETWLVIVTRRLLHEWNASDKASRKTE